MMKENLRTFYLTLILSTFLMLFQHCQSVKRVSIGEKLKSSDRIAIAAVGDNVGSEISKVAGRAPYYLIFDGNGVFLKSLINSSQSQERGASSGVVDILIKESVKTVIAGKFGDKMTKQLDTNKIEYLIHAGIAKDIVQTIIKNKRSKKNGQK